MATYTCLKAPAGAQTRNLLAPKADRLALAISFNEESNRANADNGGLGTIFNHVGKDTTTVRQTPYSYNDAGAGAVMGSGSEGYELQDGYAYLDAAGADEVFPYGTMMWRFRTASTLAAGRIAMTEAAANPSDGGIRVEIAGDKLQLKYGEPTVATHAKATTAALTADTDYTLFVVWHPDIGMRGYLNGTLVISETGWTNGGLPSPMTPVRIPAGEYAYIAEATEAADEVSKFAWWDAVLTARDMQQYLADPQLIDRPALDSDYVLNVGNPCPGHATDAGFKLRMPQGGSTPDTNYYIRAVTAETALTPGATATVGTADQIEAANDGLAWDITVASESLDEFYWIFQWSTDNTTWYNAPGGMGHVVKPRAKGTSYTFGVGADEHAVSNTGQGDDIDPSVGNENAGEGRLYKVFQDIANRDAIDFFVNLGDTTLWMWTDAGAWARAYNPLFTTCPLFLVIGNHDGECGYDQSDTATQRDATIYRKARVLNPEDDTYGTDWGENEGDPTLPDDVTGDAEDYDSNVDWIPSMSAAETPRTYFETHILNASEALGTNTSPLGNYYAWAWGDCLHIVLDVYRYTAVGNAVGETNRGNARDTPEWTLGDTQTAWLSAILAAQRDTYKHCCVYIHQLMHGYQEDNDTYYGRDSGATVWDDETYPDDDEFLAVMRQYRCVVFVGHDHNAAFAVRAGVPTIHAPTLASHFLFLLTENANNYGTLRLQGTDQPGLRWRYLCWGYLEVDITPTQMTVRLRQTTVDANVLQTQSSSTLPAKYIGPELTVAADGTVTLTEAPTDVLCACAADDGDFYTSATPAIASDFGGTQTYAQSEQTWGTNGDCLAVTAWNEPHASAIIDPGDGDYTAGDSIRVNYAPRTVQETGVGSTSSTGMNLSGLGFGSKGIEL